VNKGGEMEQIHPTPGHSHVTMGRARCVAMAGLLGSHSRDPQMPGTVQWIAGWALLASNKREWGAAWWGSISNPSSRSSLGSALLPPKPPKQNTCFFYEASKWNPTWEVKRQGTSVMIFQQRL
jgi:hypothetical protein